MERNDVLIKRRFYAYLIPGIMMMAALQLGNLVDSMFVGIFLGSDALSASSIAGPFVILIQFPMMVLSAGGSAAAGICMGKRQNSKASTVFTLCFIALLLFNIADSVAVLFYAEPLSQILTAHSAMAPLTCGYMRAYIIGMPVLGIAMLFGYFMGMDNHPKTSAAMHITANALNILFDWLFLGVFDLDISYSAWATLVGYSVSGAIFITVYLRSSSRNLKLTLKKDAENASAFREAALTGLPSGLLLALDSVKLIVLNGMVLALTGQSGMNIFAVVSSSIMIVQLSQNGVIGVIQSIAGVLIGEKDHYGIRKLVTRVIRITLVISACLVAFFMAFPGVIEAMFGFEDTALLGTMDAALRIFSISFPFYAMNSLLQIYYGTIQKTFLASLSTVLQGAAILIPVTFFMISKAGILGSPIAVIIAEAGAFSVIWMIRRIMQKKGSLPGRDFFLLPDKDPGQYLDVTITGNAENAAGLAHKIVGYCLNEGVDRRTANAVGIAGEELAYDIANRNDGNRINYIDICLAREEDSLILRIRDDGRAYDPLDNITDDENGLEISGVRLVKVLAKNTEYTRVLNMNNTVVEIGI